MSDISTDDALLLDWISERDESCPVCGYNLRGLELARCTECGSPLRLTVGVPDLNLASWFVAMLGFGLAAGFDSVVGVTMLGVEAYLRLSGGYVNAPWFLPLALVFCVVGLAMLSGAVWTYRSRAKWVGWDARTRWVRTGSIVVCVFLAHLAAGIWLIVGPF